MYRTENPRVEPNESCRTGRDLKGDSVGSLNSEAPRLMPQVSRTTDDSTYLLIAVIATLAALLLRWPLWPVLESNYPYITFFPVVMLVACCGGLRPGLLATTISAGGAWILFL
ncbi:MAG: domain S-box protein, partial [Planctomycetaceae bacterium]|nr:domain S-box protein [Planctomycetaceae bacterium]